MFDAIQNVSKPGGTGETVYGIRYPEAVRGIMQLIVFVAAGIASLLILITMIVYAVMR